MSSKMAAGRVAVPQQEAESSSSATHRMRITSGGSIQSYVAFALKHLQSNPGTPLVLHTIPSPQVSTPVALKKAPQSDINSAPVVEADDPNTKSTALTTLHSCTLTTPRLISVVELIKRDYLVGLAASGKGKGKHRATGLWQYTETGLLPDTPKKDTSDGQDVEDTRAEALKRILGGRTKPKMTHRPYLQITLSTRPLGLETQKNVTCQYVLGRRNRKGKKEKEQAVALEAAQPDNGEGTDAPSSESGNAAGTGRPSESGSRKSKGQKRKAAQEGESPGRVKRKRGGENPLAATVQ